MSKQLEKIDTKMDTQSPSANTVSKSKGGRPKGSTNKITVQSLLEAVEAATDQSFEEAIIADWYAAQDNRELRYKYNQLLFNKVVADRHHVELDETSTVANRQQAFLKALEVIGGVGLQQEQPKGLDYGSEE